MADRITRTTKLPAMQSPLVVIVGQTGSGKTALAIKLAQLFDGEIICADSRTIYRGMDIGTAKPTLTEQAGIPHYMLDIVEPSQRFTVVDFQQEANKLILDISARGRVPIMVGGTGLYIDSVLFNYKFPPMTDSPRDPVNPRHLIPDADRVRDDVLRPNTLVLGLQLDREVLRQRIAKRTENMVDAGLVEEVRQAGEKYGWEAPALQAPGYKAFREYIKGSKSLEAAKQDFVKNDVSLAKRQMTWFKRNKSIQWISSTDEAVDITTTFMRKKQ